MGDTGESNNTPVKVHINQIPLHELNLNAGFNPKRTSSHLLDEGIAEYSPLVKAE